MRVAALYDIHGNLSALEAVLAEVEPMACDRVVIGGDVALGPMPREVLDRLASLGDRLAFVRGNCDREMATALEQEPDPSKAWGAQTRWAAEQITPEQRAFLGQLPLSLPLEIEGLGAVLFCHATPRSDDEIVTRLTPESRLAGIVAGVSERVIVGGHTHVQFDREALGRRWVNAGSVGMPYEDGPGARWALLGPSIELRRTPYDFERAARLVNESGFPSADDFVRMTFTKPMTAAEASERFETWGAERARGRS